MKKIVELITEDVKQAFIACGYDPKYGKVNLSNRPDLCEYQCNGALSAAKEYKKAPIQIAGEVAQKLDGQEMFEQVTAVMPGFINIRISMEFLANWINEMAADPHFGCDLEKQPKTILIDYGGANVAKPLHVGHLRSAVIGECVKRILRFFGNHVIGDVHLGDWGLPIGLVIEELHERKPDLVYFNESYKGEYPKESPLTISELEEIYPIASAKSKKDEEFFERAHAATLRFQNGDPAYKALWNHIINISKADLKKVYDSLNVEFDLWKGESDAQPYIPAMIEDMIEHGIAYESQGAIVVDVAEETDTKEMPPCLIRKSDGASLYATTDLATLVEREKCYHPQRYIYLTDKRQELYFTQIFRVAKKAGIVPAETDMQFLGFGTMNGKDGKPFKTRSGGVMRLEYLIQEIYDVVSEKVYENHMNEENDAEETTQRIALAALKYGDLSNQAAKDFIFDTDRFTSFEGNTGPYILYTIVRIKSILAKYTANGGNVEAADTVYASNGHTEKGLMLKLSKLNDVLENAYQDMAPHKICQYIYELCDDFNSLYHVVKIINEENKKKQSGWIALLKLTQRVLELCIDLLGVEAPDRM